MRDFLKMMVIVAALLLLLMGMRQIVKEILAPELYNPIAPIQEVKWND